MDKKQLWRNLKDYHFEELVPPALWDNIKERFGGENASTKAFAGKIAVYSPFPYPFPAEQVV